MKSTKSCPICRSEEYEELPRRKVEYPGSDLYSNLLDIQYVRNYILFDRILHHREPIEFCFQICTNCGLIFFSPRPEESDMAVKYNFHNELGDTKKREEFLYRGMTSDDKRAFEIYKSIRSIQEVSNSNVIDIGGARGLCLKYFRSDNNCFVVDYERHELLDGTEYLCETAKDIPESMQAKVVLSCHTLEHVVDPVKEILKIKDILEPGGLLYIEVPFGCWNEYKRTRDFLTHINFFSEGSLYYLLDMCGLSIRYLRLKPTLNRVEYRKVIVAIAQNSAPSNRKINASQVTRSQMESTHYCLRAFQVFLNVKLLMNFKLLLAAYRRYRFLLQIRRRRKDNLSKVAEG